MKGRRDDGYAMVALLVGLTIMAITLGIALPTWSTLARREREEELIFRGQQYARAIQLYQRQYANSFPPNFDVLVDQHFLRKKYKDPMTADGEFQPVAAGQGLPGQNTNTPAQGQGSSPQQQQQQGRAGQPGQVGQVGQAQGRIAGAGLVGVVSKSDREGFRIFDGRTKYNEWVFVAQQATTRAGAPNGAQTPGPPGRGGRGGPIVPGQGGGVNFPGTPGPGGRILPGRGGQQPPTGPGGVRP